MMVNNTREKIISRLTERKKNRKKMEGDRETETEIEEREREGNRKKKETKKERKRKTHIGISSGMFDKFIWSSAVDFGADVEGLKKNYN